MIQTLKIARGEHVLISPVLLGKVIANATVAELHAEKEQFMAVCFILRSDEARYKILLDGLKRSANLGRDEYAATLTETFDLLLRESGEYDNVRHQPSNRYCGRGGCGGRGCQSYLFVQQGRGGRGNNANNGNEQGCGG